LYPCLTSPILHYATHTIYNYPNDSEWVSISTNRTYIWFGIMKTTVQLKKRGQIVIPEPVRIGLKLKEGDILEINVEKANST